LNGRNFATLVYLAPGVTAGQAGENLSGASTFNPRGASNFNALGSQANTNAWLVDGIDNNEYTFNTVIVQPTVESVREFKVLTGTFSAEFGRGAGVVSVSTKSGQNAWHGTAFEYLRNVASIYPLPNGPGNFDNYTSTVNRSVRDHSFTGRIDHRAGNKDNFFARFSYEKYKLDAPQGQAACCLPTPGEAAAAFDLGPF